MGAVNPDEVPARKVSHDFDDDGDGEFGPMIGEAQTLPMTQAQKKLARERRERLDALGGFRFGQPR